jgi:hypothetical protein
MTSNSRGISTPKNKKISVKKHDYRTAFRKARLACTTAA